MRKKNCQKKKKKKKRNMKLNLTNFPKFKFKFKFWKYKFEGNLFFKFLKIASNTILMRVPKWLFVF